MRISTQGFLNIVKLLVSTIGIDINLESNDNITPLWIAIQNGHLDIVLLLLEQKEIDVNKSAMEEGGLISPLQLAIELEDYEIIWHLLRHPSIVVSEEFNQWTQNDSINRLLTLHQTFKSHLLDFENPLANFIHFLKFYNNKQANLFYGPSESSMGTLNEILKDYQEKPEDMDMSLIMKRLSNTDLDNEFKNAIEFFSILYMSDIQENQNIIQQSIPILTIEPSYF